MLNFMQLTPGGVNARYLLRSPVILLPPARVISESAVDWAYGFSPLSDKTSKSNHLQMSEQRQHFPLEQ